jgi:tetrapyrrole methylase family protein / MazG family protein
VAERTVELLRADDRVEVEILPSLSFADMAWARLGVDPVAAGVRMVDGRSFAVEAAGERGPLLVAQCDSKLVLSAIKLAVEGDGPSRVVVLQRLGLADEAVFEVAWDDLDRSFEPDHLTSVYIPELAAPVAVELARFHELVRTLRERCPWDREQTHESLARHLLEESYEVLDAIASGDPHELEEELGDLLFQVVFHAVLGAEEGDYTLADIARGIHDKLVGRHPHVFADVAVSGAEEVVANWEQIKKAEKGRASVMDGIPKALPALLYAYKVGRKAGAVGFDWDEVGGVLDKVDEELAELRAEVAHGERSSAFEEELGDLLFATVNVARHLEIDPEGALRAATDKFRRRFEAMEVMSTERGVPISDDLWDEVKRNEPNSGP